MKKASITVYLSLLFSVICGLICTSVLSAKVQAARLLAISAMDQSLYSLMAEYDRDMLEAFDLFVLDAGYEAKEFRSGIINDKLKDYQEEILSPRKISFLWGGNLLSIERKTGGITGYAFASDKGGRLLKAQAIHAMKDTYLQGKAKELLAESLKIDRVLEENKGKSSDEALLDYDHIKEEAMQKEREKAEAKEAAEESGEEGDQEGEETKEENEEESREEEEEKEKVSVPPNFKNPIDMVSKIKKEGVLALVLDEKEELSEEKLDVNKLLSKRKLAAGLGDYDLKEDVDDTISDLIYREYLMEKFSSYGDKSKDRIKYQLEYFIGGDPSDKENLRKVVHELLLVREAANLAYLYTDAEKREEALAFCQVIAAAIGLPVIAPALQFVLLSCWAFGESIMDVRHLLEGGKVPLIKNKSTWQLSLEKLADVESAGREEKKEEGLSYEGYLRLLLLKENQEELLFRSMDLMEEKMRSEYHKENFRLDNSIVYIESFMNVNAERQKEYEVIRAYGYDM